MNISGYPSYFDELPEEPTSCYNCSNDCMGILDIIFKEGSDDQ